MSCKPTYKGKRYDSLEDLFRSLNITLYNKEQNDASKIKEGVSELFEFNFFIFEESKTSEEIINKLINNKIIEKKCD